MKYDFKEAMILTVIVAAISIIGDYLAGNQIEFLEIALVSCIAGAVYGFVHPQVTKFWNTKK